jgi:VWFA-related protein
MQSTRFGRYAALIVALLATVPANAQKKPQTFTGSTDVVAVEIPVQVLRDGEPVRGLKETDFEVFDGRKKQTVTGFEVLDLGTAEAETPAAEVPIAGRRHFMMLFDLTFSEPRSIIRARAAAKDLLAQLHPTDLLAVATYSTLQGPQLVLGFTPDRRQAAVAIDTLGVPKLMERGGDPLRLALTSIRGELSGGKVPTGAQSPGATASADAKAAREQAMLDTFEDYSAAASRADRARQAELVQRLTLSFAQLAKLMSSVEGRKYVVYLSQGFDSSLLSGTVDNVKQQEMQDASLSGEGYTTNSDERYGDTKSGNQVEKMLDEFRRADCIVQAVDISGLRAEGDQGPRLAGGKDSLLQMAKDTGGEFFENFNDLNAAMGKMLKNTSVTYVLTIQPENLKPGDYRKLKVELKGAARGTKVVYRQGYYAPKTYAQQNPLEKLLGTSNQLMGQESGSVQAAVLAAPFKVDGPQAYVPVLIEVDGPSLLQGKQGPQLPVEIYVYALDQDGGVSGFVTQTFGLDLAKAEPMLRQGGFKFFGHLDLPPGSYTLRVLVRNGTTGASALRIAKLEVPAFGQGPVLLPAFFPDAGTHWLMAREAQKPDDKQVPYPFMRKDQAYIPSSRPVLKPGSDVAVALVGYNLAAGQWKAEAKVLSAEGQEVGSGGLKLLAADPGVAGGAARAEGSFKTPDLPPGQYWLKVTLTDANGGSGSSVSSFAVVAAGG